jgi:hypothetical protein
VTGSPAPALAELVALARPTAMLVWRRLPAVVVGLAVLVSALAGLSLVGAAVHDSAIESNRALASAEVLEGSTAARTLVRFTVPNGQAVVPERGVLYPRGLQPGDTVTVEYDLTDPEIVRVAGRSAVDGIGPVALGVLGVWTVLGPSALWLRHRRRRDPHRPAVASR